MIISENDSVPGAADDTVESMTVPNQRTENSGLLHAHCNDHKAVTLITVTTNLCLGAAEM